MIRKLEQKDKENWNKLYSGYADFYKKDLVINTLGPVGDLVEEWTIKGAWCQATNMGTLDWSTSEFMTVELTVSYDYAILQY